MLGSQQSNDVFVADEEHDCSLLGQDHSRKIRAKPVRVSLVFFAARNQMRHKVDEVFQARNGFNCLGFIPIAVLNQRGKGDGLR